MDERQHVEPSRANLEKVGGDNVVRTVPSNSSPELTPEIPKTDKPKSVKELSAEEQMALYEKELKENDWGHQPC